MLGYHDSPTCHTDIWAPKPDTWGNNAIENRAFSPFCLHETENEELIEAIGSGNTSVDLSDRTTDDLIYIQKQVLARYSIWIDYTN